MQYSENIHNLKKLPQMSIEININYEMTVFNIKIPDTVLACQIPEGAGLNKNQQQMALILASNLILKAWKDLLKEFLGVRM